MFVRFVALTYAISWSFWLLLAASRRGWIIELPPMLFNLLGGSGPAVAALVLTAASGGRNGVRVLASRLLNWRVPSRFYLLAVLLPPVLMALVVLALAAPTGGAVGWTFRPPGAVAGFFVLLLLILPLEELGWRGFAFPLLQRTHGGLAAAGAVGVVWSLWHLPLFLIPGERAGEGRAVQILLFLLFIPLLSVLLAWLFNRSNGSLLPPLILHASYNASVSAATPPEALGTAFRVMGLAATLALCLFLIWRSGPERLGRPG